jgi:hypothetical protein
MWSDYIGSWKNLINHVPPGAADEIGFNLELMESDEKYPITLRAICFGLPASKKMGQIFFLRKQQQFEFSTPHPSEIYHVVIRFSLPSLQRVGGGVE